MASAAKSAWTFHFSKDGRRYFFNTVTKKSQWDKPDELKTEEERLIESKTPWKIYETAQGKSYYYNTETKASVWQVPPDVKELLASHSSQSQPDKEALREQFMKWLQGFNFNQKTTWESAIKVLESHPGWLDFSALSRGDKKQYFSEFASQIHRRGQEELLRKKKMLGQLITDALKTWDELDYHTTYANFCKHFHDAEWFEWSSERERDDIFQEYIESNEKELKQRRKQRKTEAIERLIEELNTAFSQSDELLTWSKVKDMKWANMDELHLIDLLGAHKCIFRDFHKQKYKKAQEQSLRFERKCRTRFLSFLEECVTKGEIDATTDYSDFIRPHSKEAVYLDMVGHSGSTPYDLFKEVQRPLKREFHNKREAIKQLIYKGKLKRDASFSEFQRAIMELEWGSDSLHATSDLQQLYKSICSSRSHDSHGGRFNKDDEFEEGEIPVEDDRRSVESVSSASLNEP